MHRIRSLASLARHAVCITRVTARGHAIPVRRFVLELAAPERGQPVELGAAVVVRRAPLGFQQPAHLEPVQRRIERALLDLAAPRPRPAG